MHTAIFVYFYYCSKNVFVRIYDLTGKKIAKGRIVEITDSTILLKGYEEAIHISEVGFLRTKHSMGSNLGWGTLIGFSALTTVGYIVYANNNDAYLAGLNILAGATLGTLAGFVGGAITLPFKKIVQYDVNGDSEKWQAFRFGISRPS
ncbi:MAG: hypothetical protein DI598_04885 [Pseudopedobacter saltans]|uniref:Uncharacterized protein n=1 Tax=Pseudopedobacter saltans TaxID=151895 RepID=A0A2W5F938_9SPHI|nr:MAG: hypothetical protein DI598_04885 [Pseudopedobacter saltans]